MEVVSFGKYRGWTHTDLCARYPGYISWAARRPRSTCDRFNAFRSYCRRVRNRKLLYVLPLAGARYYVGVTSFPVHRLWQHRTGAGAKWTRLHRPTRGFSHLREVPSDVAPAIFEDMWVKQLMLQHGVDRVRGGTYSAVHLSDAQERAIAQEMRHACWNECMVPDAPAPETANPHPYTSTPPRGRLRSARAHSPCPCRLFDQKEL